jgi:predicted house-cleaning NTP pyrophosphatase (Maf/HAM1 superfamily)
MRPYTDAEIDAYIASGDPFDKAGAYAIQHPTFRPVARIAGCFLSVVGLPLPEVYSVLTRAGVPTREPAESALDAICPGCTDKNLLLGT